MVQATTAAKASGNSGIGWMRLKPLRSREKLPNLNLSRVLGLRPKWLRQWLLNLSLLACLRNAGHTSWSGLLPFKDAGRTHWLHHEVVGVATSQFRALVIILPLLGMGHLSIQGYSLWGFLLEGSFLSSCH